MPSPQTDRSRTRTGSGRNRSALCAAVLVACLGLLAGACNDSGGSDTSKDSERVSRDEPGASDGASTEEPDPGDTSNDDTSTGDANAGKGPDTGDADGADAGESTGGDGDGGSGDFVADVEAAIEGIGSAESTCELFDTLSAVTDFGNPQSRAETEAAVNFVVVLMNKMADVTDNADLSGRLSSGATNLAEYARSVDYDPVRLDLNGEGPAYAGASEDEAAMDEFLTDEIDECMAAEFGDSGS